jgi:hypothetical protein
VIHEIKRRVTQDWKGEWLFVVPFLIFPVHMMSVFMTGGGHASFLGYIPILVVDGPVFFLDSLLDLYNYNRWGDYIPMLFGYAAPSFLYLLYSATLLLSTPAHRWSILKVLVIIHLSFSLISGYRIYNMP